MKEKSDNQQIATAIRVALAEKNVKREVLASMTGYPIQRINTMCAGRHDFNIEEIAKLESVLGIKLLLIPSVQRVITITMDIDKDARLAKIRMKTTENGLPKEKWTANELLSTANALILKAQAILESGFPYPEDDVEEGKPDDASHRAPETGILEYSEQQH